MSESQQRLQPVRVPHCVCSDATDSHGIEPLAIAGDPQLMWRRLQDYLAQQRGFTIKQVDDLYLRVEAKTPYCDSLTMNLSCGPGMESLR